MTGRPLSDAPRRKLRASWHVSSLVGIVTSLAVAGTALAGWAGHGAGAGVASVGTLGLPTVSGVPGGGMVTLTWTAVTRPGGSGAMTYYVQRDGADAAGDCPVLATPTAVTTCVDRGLTSGLYTYTVVAVWHSWTATSGPLVVNVPTGALDHFLVTATTSTPTAGVAFNVTLKALDAGGLVVTSYAGSHCIHFTGPATSPNPAAVAPAWPLLNAAICGAGVSYIPFTAGQSTEPVTLYRAQSTFLKVDDSIGHTNASGLGLTVNPGPAASFSIPVPATQTAGIQFAVSMSALDAYSNNATTYAGAKCLTFSGPDASPSGTGPTYPPKLACASGSSVTFAGGSATGIPITLYMPSTTTHLTATEAGTGATGTSANFTVVGGSASRFALSVTGTPTAGTAFSATIGVFDGYGNPVSYTGVHCLTFSGLGNSPNLTAPVYPPAQGTCAASAVTFSNGSATASVTAYNAASATLTATEGSVTGTSAAFTLSAAGISRFSMTAASTTPVAGSNDLLTITAIDLYGNVATGYTGSHGLTFGGATGVIATFTPYVTDSGNNHVVFGTAINVNFTAGIGTGTMVLYRPGTFPITVTDGTHNNSAAPLSVTVRVVAVQVSAGGAHSCALLSYGAIQCWGENGSGQLGDGTQVDKNAPVYVNGITNAVAVSAGLQYTCAVLATGAVQCWGSNQYGQLGNGTTTTASQPVTVSNVTTATSVQTGAYHTCARLADNNVWCWGWNSYGQLGDNTTNTRTTPVHVLGLNGTGYLAATSLAAGQYFSCAVTPAGAAQCWGRNNYGQIGDNSTTTRYVPVQVANLTTGVAAVSAGQQFTCARLTAGGAMCWGRNSNYGQLGNGTGADSHVPVAVTGAAGLVTIGAGYRHSCYTTGSGAARCWGWNGQGQIGDGTTTTRTTPVAVSGITTTAAQISSGGGNVVGTYEHTVVLLTDGTIRSWGDNTSGQLGNGVTGTDSSVPVITTLK